MNRIHILFLGLIIASTLLSSCKNDDDTEFDCIAFEWEYEGERGPDAWSTCSTDCGGQSQSPINIAGAVVDAGLSALETQYLEAPIELINNGHTIQFDYEQGSTLELNGDTYNLLQFHFHTGSEHTVDGLQHPMEVHLVHQNAAGNLAVIGIFFQEGSENTFLASFNENLPLSTDAPFSSTNMVNVGDLLPTNGSYYTYGGSLTTPPCAEIVTWLVLKTPIEASTAQIQNMRGIIKESYRPVQPLNGRVIKEFN